MLSCKLEPLNIVGFAGYTVVYLVWDLGHRVNVMLEHYVDEHFVFDERYEMISLNRCEIFITSDTFQNTCYVCLLQ